MNVLMISIGDGILSNPIGDALERQKKYAKALGYIDMIVFSPKLHNLKAKHYENLSIYPTKSLGMVTFVYDVLKIAKSILKNKKIDVITTQDPFGTALAGYLIKRRYGIPLHIQNHSSFLDNKLWIEEKPILFNLFNQIAHFTLKRADKLRVVNTLEKKRYVKILGIDEKRIDVAPVPVNVEFWQKEPTKDEKEAFLQKYSINLKKPILSWVGRPVKVKNLPYLFKSLSLVEKEMKVNLLIAGNMTNSFWNLKELEEKFNIKPIYLGLLTHEELRVMYYITDVYLHTSNYEGFGLVVSEAQACGCVVVSCDTAGAIDIIEDKKSGYLIKGAEERFSDKVLELLKNKDRLLIMSSYAKKMIKDKFDNDIMFRNIIDSIKESKN